MPQFVNLTFSSYDKSGNFEKKIMGVLKQVAEYLYIRKKDPNSTSTQWMKYMHGINRISILLFLFALVVMFIKFVVM